MQKVFSPILFISKASDGHMGTTSPANRKKYFSKLGVSEREIVDMRVTHGNKIKKVGSLDGGRLLDGYDGLITNQKGLFLGLLVADCIPISIYDPVHEAIGLVHAGWKNLMNGTIRNALRLMEKSFGTKPTDTIIYMGAHICVKHYEVKDDVASLFGKNIKVLGGKKYLDLGEAAKAILEESGVRGKNITLDPSCNFEQRELFSYRRGDLTERNLYLMGMVAQTS